MQKSLVSLFLSLVVLGACSSHQVATAPPLLPETKRIVVVPVGVSAPAGTAVDGWVLFGSPSSPQGEAGPALISDALSLFERELEHEGLPAKQKAGSKAARKTWNPALTLAREAATLISSASPYEVSVREKPHTLSSSGPGDPRFLLQDWYQRNVPALNPDELGDTTNTRVIELGLPEYALMDDQLLLQVLVKIVDPSTGQVTARAANRVMIDIESPEKLFIHGGREFKTVFVAEGRRLLERNLRDLGVLPGRDAMIH